MLKTSLLDRDRPFIRTPTAVRNLLLNLLQLERLLAHYLRSPESSRSASLQEIIRQARIERTLQAVISSPSLNGLPSIRILAIYTLSTSRNLSSKGSPTTVTPPELNVPILSNTPFDDLTDIASANREISTLEDPSGEKSSVRHESEFTTLEREYISRALSFSSEVDTEQMNGSTVHEAKESELASFLLGYNVLSSSDRSHALANVHQQRIHDILGPAVSTVMEVCKTRGFFCKELDPAAFWQMVKIYEHEGKGEGFAEAVREVESGVERKLGLFLGRFFGEGGIGNRELDVPDSSEEGKIERVQGQCASAVLFLLFY